MESKHRTEKKEGFFSLVIVILHGLVLNIQPFYPRGINLSPTWKRVIPVTGCGGLWSY
jgi:hypothetical protein